MGDEMMREMDEMGLDEVFRLLADYNPKTTPHKPLKQICTFVKPFDWKIAHDDDEYRYVSLASVNEATKRILKEKCDTVTKGNHPSRAKWILQTDDVVFAVSWPERQNIAYVSNEYDGYLASSGFVVLRCDKNLVLPKYLYYAVLSNSFYRYIMSVSNGEGYTSIKPATLMCGEIPLPSLPVQHAITTILDTLTTLEQELEQELEQRNKQYQHYRNAIIRFSQTPIDSCDERIGDVLKYEQPAKYLVSDTNYTDTGIPVLTPGKTFILGYTQDANGTYDASEQNAVILFDDFTTASRYIDFPFKIKSSAVKLLTVSNKEKYDLRYFFYYLQTIAYTPTEHSRQWISKISEKHMIVPPIETQREIARRLFVFDDMLHSIIGALPGEIAQRKKQFECLLNILF